MKCLHPVFVWFFFLVSISDHVLPLNEIRKYRTSEFVMATGRAWAWAGPGADPSAPLAAPETPPQGPTRRGGAQSPAQPRPGRVVPDLRRLEAGNAPSGSARQARGPRPAGVGDCAPAGTESGLGRCWAGAPKLSRSAGGPLPPDSRCQNADPSLSVGSFAFLLRLGQTGAPCLSLGAERLVVGTGGRARV